jgi:hypothetical protein
MQSARFRWALRHPRPLCDSLARHATARSVSGLSIAAGSSGAAPMLPSLGEVLDLKCERLGFDGKVGSGAGVALPELAP